MIIPDPLPTEMPSSDKINPDRIVSQGCLDPSSLCGAYPCMQYSTTVVRVILYIFSLVGDQTEKPERAPALTRLASEQ